MSRRAEGEPAPLLRVLRGEPSAAELAALVAVLTARAPATRAGSAGARSGWADRAAGLRPALRPGPGRWRTSGRPG